MITIEVRGIPAGQGAIRYGPTGKGYHADKKTRPWKALVMDAVAEAWGGAAPWTAAVEVQACWYFPHLKSHYRSNGQLKDDAPAFKTTAPDLDHLQRAVGDALEGAGAIINDSQICSWLVSKGFSEQPGLHLIIRRL